MGDALSRAEADAGTPVKHEADLNHGGGMRNGEARPEERDGQGVAIPSDVE